jgi:acyl-CoA reductase-like NAD-dependent aldehyde dehydrogenase/nicotinamidase-related amidase
MKPLLILVDLQQDYLKSPQLDPAAGSVVDGAAALLAQARAEGIPVLHVWTTVTREPDNRMAHWKREGLWQCEAGTEGHAPPAALAPRQGEQIIHKSGFSTPDIAAFVQGLGRDTIIVAGVKTHACVRQLALDICQAGLAVIIAADAVGSDDPLHAAATRRYFKARGIEFLSNTELKDLIGEDAAKAAPETPSFRVDEAVASASAAAKSWRGSASTERAKLLRALASVLAQEVEPLAKLMAEEVGKPLKFGRREGASVIEMLGVLAKRASEETPAANGLSYAERRRPHGVVAAITPWNNPLYLPLGKIAPAVLYGNAVVWKPAPEARAVSRHLAACLAKAGWPDGLVQLLEGGEREGMALMSHAEVGAVTLTGGSLAGYAAQEICGRRRIALQAELGGNNAAIVWSDADLGDAARKLAAGAYEMAGQRCTANRRVILHACIRDTFLPLLVAATKAMRWGDPSDPETDIGPMVSVKHRDRVAAMVDRAFKDCAQSILPLGEAPASDARQTGKFYPPIIIACDDTDSEIVQEESFGPVLVVQTARDFDHAISLMNGVRQGLAAALFTASTDIERAFLDRAEAGILKINQSTAGADVDAPFGGWKSSGLGPPEHGRFDLEFFTRQQTVYAGEQR